MGMHQTQHIIFVDIVTHSRSTPGNPLTLESIGVGCMWHNKYSRAKGSLLMMRVRITGKPFLQARFVQHTATPTAFAAVRGRGRPCPGNSSEALSSIVAPRGGIGVLILQHGKQDVKTDAYGMSGKHVENEEPNGLLLFVNTGRKAHREIALII